MKIFLVLLAFVAFTFAIPTNIHPSVLENLQRNGKVSIAVEFKQGVSSAYDAVGSKSFESRGDKISFLKTSLIANAAKSQKIVREYLDSHRINFSSHWISNLLIITEASVDTVLALSAIDDVSLIRESVTASLAPTTVVGQSVTLPRQQLPQWNVQKIYADALWSKGNRGNGTVVAIMDSGVHLNHRILVDGFAGDYGWYDPEGKTSLPYDVVGQGTHAAGIAVGQEGYGVAPAAKWMACMACPLFSCSEQNIWRCSEFLVCPTLWDGGMPDCSKAPNVVANGWFTNHPTGWFDSGIEAWKAAGIIPTFPVGPNSPDQCEHIYVPADGVALGIGATTITDTLSARTALGPSPTGKIKPDLTAPGDTIMSAWAGGDYEFQLVSGTTMAAAHVAGSIALLIVEKPHLNGNFDETSRILFAGAETSGLVGNNQTCGGIDEATFPNNAFGHGRLDVLGSSFED